MFPHLLTLKPLLKISPMTSHKNINKIENIPFGFLDMPNTYDLEPGKREFPPMTSKALELQLKWTYQHPTKQRDSSPTSAHYPKHPKTKTKNCLNYAEQSLQEYKRIRVLLAGWCLNEQPNISVGLANLIVIWFRWIRKDWGVVLLSLEMGKVEVIPLREKSYFDEVALNRFGPLRT